MAGGIVGRYDCLTATQPNVFFCFNGGDIYGESVAGGIVGRIMFCLIQNCYNYGTITTVRNPQNGDATNVRYAGGIVGWYNSNGSNVSICYNVGTITYIDALVANTNIYLGGVVGHKQGANTNSMMSQVVCLNQTGLTGGAATNDGVWGFGGNTGITVATCYVMADSDMKQTSMAAYPAGFTNTNWTFRPGYAYPQLEVLPHVAK